MQAAVERTAAILKDAGAVVSDFDLPQIFTNIIPDAAIINAWEASIMLEVEVRDHLDGFNDHNRERVEWVKDLSEDDYLNAGKALDNARSKMDTIYDGFDLILSPSLPGEAPVGLTEVRSATFARLWTQMYTPSVNFPLFESLNGIPICFQLVGMRSTDNATLANAKWADGKLRAALGDVPVQL